ncbi:unnamed protein product [Sphagnum troendelagicum]|uniref:Uncharacterized protein n=1 Tax=Sphagnum troendelagicum TaxID=128251 RepID=A0ABP0TF48_9BRYO
MDETEWVEVTREGGKKQGQLQDLSPDQQQSNALMVPKFDSSDPCTYSTMRKYSCSMSAGSDSSEPVQRCHRIEQLLKKCPGRPVEIVESKSEYTERDIATRSMIWGGKDGDELVAVPRESMDSDWLRNMMPRPFGDSEWQRGSQHREESNDSSTRSTIPSPFGGRQGGHPGGVLGAFEDLVTESEHLAQSFLQVFGLDSNERNFSGNLFGDLFQGHQGRDQRKLGAIPEAFPYKPPPAQSTSPKANFSNTPTDFREV